MTTSWTEQALNQAINNRGIAVSRAMGQGIPDDD